MNNIEELERNLAIKEAYIEMIIDKCIGYDGNTTYKGMKDLADEILIYAKLARDNNDKEICFIDGHNKGYNIIKELVKEDINE